ncbi:SDR family oxidoreductase [Janibacter cremeus]|uniref:Uncharacterized protein YbjT (DUF2867 family) n=1 Tax=Janibacter cremeus TaxID=1285192 RepID=A0A852VL28_9MICO|nr:SDR family oxidoreductase [Janibacter cremeus]NYF96639.1 uncharacterized protein YbjT (DUF2867 family) [Janibacter cremeus]
MRIAIAGGTGVVGHHVVAAARARGHKTVVLSRRTGADLYEGTGIDERLTGVDTVIDATSVQTISARTSIDFFRTVTQHLVTAGRRCGVRHHIAISVIGAQTAPFSYYAGKRVQEELVLDQTIGTVVRAGQFHEFAQQMMARTKAGPVYAIPRMRSQPVAASEVAGLLVDVAEQEPQGVGPEIAGPQELRVADLARRVIDHEGGRSRVIEVPFPGGFGRAMRDGTLIARAGTTLGRQTFSEWLAGQAR